jgi:hypothetical protein
MPEETLFRKSKKLSLLHRLVGDEGLRFLRFGLGSINRILPHSETDRWRIKLGKKRGKTKVAWKDATRRALILTINLSISDFPSKRKPPDAFQKTPIYHFLLTSTFKRKAKSIQRTLDSREMDLCSQIVRRVSSILGRRRGGIDAESLRAIRSLFEEQVIAAHLCQTRGIKTDLAEVFSSLRELAEQSYENKALSYGIVFVSDEVEVPDGCIFPQDFFEFKRYKAMSDGFKTAFRLSSNGKVLGLVDLRENSPKARLDHFYPEWTQYLAESSREDLCGICLTRQGDILVFDGGSLRFTYRSGRWQYWNHRHVIDFLRDRARAQHVSRNLLPDVVRTLYRAVLDVSFRRSGGLFVLLRNQRTFRRLVLEGDAIGDSDRDKCHDAFDESLTGKRVFSLSRLLLDEISGLDGAVVVSNHGRLLAYGAVLQPNKRDKFNPSEGSRTKAAITASKFGIAIKVSSDGDITFYEQGKSFLKL